MRRFIDIFPKSRLIIGWFCLYYAREKSVLFGVVNVVFYCYLCGPFSNRAQVCDAVLHTGVTY